MRGRLPFCQDIAGAGGSAGVLTRFLPVGAASLEMQSWLSPLVLIAIAGVGGGILAGGGPAGIAGAGAVGLLVTAGVLSVVTLSGRINDRRVVVPGLVGVGLCGAGLDWLADGQGYVVGYMALVGLALRTSRRVALLAGSPIVAAVAAEEAYDSTVPAATSLAVLSAYGFLFVISEFAAVSLGARQQAEALLAQEAAAGEAREREAVLAERSRLARDLHDVLAHSLSVLAVQLEAARVGQPPGPGLRDRRRAGHPHRAGDRRRPWHAGFRGRADGVPRRAGGPDERGQARGAGSPGHRAACLGIRRRGGVGRGSRRRWRRCRPAVGRLRLDQHGRASRAEGRPAARGSLRRRFRGPPVAARPPARAEADVMRAAVPDGVPGIPCASGPAGTVRVLVADDQKVVRDGLSLLLGLLPGIEVIGTAIDGTDAVRQAVTAGPDVVLMDLNMPNCDGIEATRRIVGQQSYIRVVVLTAFSDDDSVFAALQAGARGFLTKNASAGEILQAISAVCAGDAQLDPSVQRRLVEAVVSGGPLGGAGTPPPEAGPGYLAPDGLTQREVEVLTEIAAGLSNAEIAGKFRISGATVKTHINHLLTKTGMRDRAQLVGYAFRHGLAA